MKKRFIKLKDINNSHRDCVLAYGHFTTIHTGHIRYLRYAKKKGKRLIVALLGDKTVNDQNMYAFSQLERAESLDLLSIANYILLMGNESLEETVICLKPKIIILGKEFENSNDIDITNAISFQKSKNGQVEYHAGEINYVNSDLFHSSKSKLANKRKKNFLDTCKKESITKEKIFQGMKSWKDLNLLVIGDTIVDQYASCEPIGISAEAPVVVVKELQKKNFIGGAAIVANHIKSLGAKCTFLSVTGSDSLSNYVNKELLNNGINSNLIKDKTRPTTLKKRYMVENQKLFRVSKLEEHKLNKEIEEQIINKLRFFAPSINAIVVSDFVYGVITKKILEEIQYLSKKYSLKLFGDLQCSSQVGDVTNFTNFSLICPNEKEARIALKDKETGLEKLSQILIDKTKTERLIMKLGSEGFIAYDATHKKVRSQSFPAISVNPLDVAGAGDSLLALMAIGLSSNLDIMTTSAIGCCVTALAVETMGNMPIHQDQLISKIKNVFEK